MSNYKAEAKPVQGIIEKVGEAITVTTEESLKDKLVCKHYKSQFEQADKANPIPKIETMYLFSKEDIEKAIKACNFNKSMGPDGFDGSLLKRKEYKDALIQDIRGMLNDNTIPDYAKAAKLIVLSKTGRPDVEVGNTRPICVTSHLLKVMEKAILAKSEETQSKLLASKDWQRGFKKGASCHTNLAEVLDLIHGRKQRRRKNNSYLAIDLTKAYDKVDRTKLF